MQASPGSASTMTITATAVSQGLPPTPASTAACSWLVEEWTTTTERLDLYTHTVECDANTCATLRRLLCRRSVPERDAGRERQRSPAPRPRLATRPAFPGITAAMTDSG